MKVNKLIKQLQKIEKINPEQEVGLDDWGEGFYPDKFNFDVSIQQDGDNDIWYVSLDDEDYIGRNPNIQLTKSNLEKLRK